MLFRPELWSLVITGAAGILVGLLILWFQQAAALQPAPACDCSDRCVDVDLQLDRLGLIYGSANLIITPLITFLPGALLTTGMIELASMHIISGSARLIYGAAVLFLLFIGIAIGLNISGLPNVLVYHLRGSCFPWWAPIPGHSVVWHWYLHPAIWIQSRSVLDAAGSVYRHARSILGRVFWQFLTLALF